MRVDPLQPDAGLLAQAAALLRDGRLVAFPTETVYGLGAHALDRAAVRRIFDAKGRPATDPLIVHLASADAAGTIVASLPDAARRLADRFWPGPLTIVLPRSPRVPDEVTAGLDTVAVRVPAHPVALALLEAAGVPVAAPSANRFSRPSPTEAAHVLHDLDGRIDLVVDAGPTTVGLESTVLDLSRETPTVLRPGAVTIEMLRTVVPDVVFAGTMSADAGPLASPGLLPKHYSPRVPLTLYVGDRDRVAARIAQDARAAIERGARVGVLAADEDAAPLLASLPGLRIARLGSRHDPAAIAARLYAALHELDRADVDLILAPDPAGEGGLAAAIRDRLTRAAAGRVVTT